MSKTTWGLYVCMVGPELQTINQLLSLDIGIQDIDLHKTPLLIYSDR